MEKIKILLVEDEKHQRELFHDAVALFEAGNEEYKIEVVEEGIVNANVFKQILQGIDFLVVDLRIPWEGGGGDEIIQTIKRANIVPISIVTGHRGDLSDLTETTFYRIYDKWSGEGNVYETVLGNIRELYDTWFTKVVGKHGSTNEILASLVWDNGLENIREWARFGNSEKAEKSLSRYILSHLHHGLSGDYEDFHPEEAYIIPSKTGYSELVWDFSNQLANPKELKLLLKKYFRTGTIVKKDEALYVVMNPACDLANWKQEKFLLAAIEGSVNEHSCLGDKLGVLKNAEAACQQNQTPELLKKKKEAKKNIDDYYRTGLLKSDQKNLFFLPKSKLFEGGYVNFRQLYRIELAGIVDYVPYVQIASSFLKDLISEFGYYCSRQGHPNINEEVVLSYVE